MLLSVYHNYFLLTIFFNHITLIKSKRILKPMIVIFSGPSGVGKNTVIKELMKINSNYMLMPTFTTREPRKGEREGFPYYFVDKAKFEEMITAGEFLEYEVVHEVNYYGTSKKIVEQIAYSDMVFMKDIDVKGAMNLVRELEGKIQVMTIFLTIGKDELFRRLTMRGEKDIELRMKRYDLETSYASKYNHIIENHSLKATAKLIAHIVEKNKKQLY